MFGVPPCLTHPLLFNTQSLCRGSHAASPEVLQSESMYDLGWLLT